MSICDEPCNKTGMMRMYNQNIVPVDPGIEAKLITILREKFNVTGIQAVNQQFLEKFLRGLFFLYVGNQEKKV
jgi:hypothetical protein